MRVLIGASGSYGDIYPFVALGRELKARGHEPVLFVAKYFEPLVEAAGLHVVPIGPAEAYEAILRHPDAFHPRRGFRLVAQANMAHLPEIYREMDARVVPGETLVVASTLAFGARLLRETRGVPTAIAHLAPSVFRSAIDPPKFGEPDVPRWLPAAFFRLLFRVVDALVVDPVFGNDLNRFRSTLGLPRVTRLFHRWIHEADLVLALFPAWFAERRPDWPRNLAFAGFPLYDGATSPRLGADAEGFLDAGAPPVVFTAGTAAANERAFYEASVEACRLAGLRGILLTRFPEQLPRELPEGVRHFEALAFSLLFPRVAAVVHHGGIGTASQAMAAGLPQLVRPLAYDQFDNARRLERLGVARSLAPKRYRPETAAEALGELLVAPAVAASCREARAKLEGANGIGTASDLLLERLGPNVPSSEISGTFLRGTPS